MSEIRWCIKWFGHFKQMKTKYLICMLSLSLALSLSVSLSLCLQPEDSNSYAPFATSNRIDAKAAAPRAGDL